MRLTTRARTLTLALGLATLVTAPATAATAQSSFSPAPAAAAPALGSASGAGAAWVGVYRVDITRGTETIPVRVIMERVGNTLDGTILVGGTASALGSVRADGMELRADITTSEGRGELVLKTTTEGISGTLKIGKTTWTVAGARSV